ncbi:MAG TPA: tricarballylate utilization 4Fe-4S protein TcuB [Candidatus Limnocylindrales bacterium]|nr:tricarballylate utilization 4Fe-4S protein TcuB [Candidatus Limnocylindrales bacterium]
MIDVRLLAEADRTLTACNACRYCEGVCPVFTSMERRRTFAEADIIHLANLCHDCRVCYEVCPFSPPHEIGINVPKVLAEVREATYRGYSAPQLVATAFEHGTPAAAFATTLAILTILAAVLLFRGDRLIATFTGPGAFYEVIPWLGMVIPAMVVSIYGLAVIFLGLVRFWRMTDGPLLAKLDLRALVEASLDVLGLREMDGGGPGCTYPDERPNHRRRISHQLVFYGFILTFISTGLAAVTQDILGVLPPYPFLHPVVLTGTVGGIFQIVGCLALIRLKLAAGTVPVARVMRSLDFAFLLMLILVNADGLALLVLRETPWLGALLVIHLGSVGGLYLTMPYGKFVHFIYRYAALLRNRQEEIREERLDQLSAGA